MTQRMRTAFAIAAAALAGCSTTAPAGTYVKAGANPEQIARDQLECVAQASATDQRSGMVTGARREDIDQCMFSRGYTRQAGR
jgi:predicted small secreted protein